MSWTKETFRKAVSVSPGSYRVYVETSDVDAPTPLGAVPLVTKAFTNACVILEPDKKAFIYMFADTDKKAAQKFAGQCKKAAHVGVVEGPELVS